MKLKTRQDHLDTLDKSNDPNGLSEKYIIGFENLKTQYTTNETVLELLSDSSFQKHITELQKSRNNTMKIDNAFNKDEYDHLLYLSKTIPDTIIQTDRQIFGFVYNTLDFIAKVVVSINVKEHLKLDNPIIDETLSRIMDKFTKPIKDRIEHVMIDKKYEQIAGIIRDWLTNDIYIQK